jgi:HTH domain
MRGRLYNRIKKAAHGREGRTFSESQSATPKDTATTLAEQHGVSRRTVIRDGKRAEALEKLALDAERRMGELLRATERASGGQPYQEKSTCDVTSQVDPTLKELGVSRKESSRAQRLAEMPAIPRRLIVSPHVTTLEGGKKRWQSR